MRRRDQISALAGMCALSTAVLAIGGAVRWAQAAVAALIAIALIIQLPSHRRLLRLSPLIAVLVLAAGLTALQIVPVSPQLMEKLNPTGQELRHAGTALAGVSTWTSITMDVPGSVRALTFFLTLIGGAVLALRFSGSERGRHVVLGAVAAVCGITAVVVGIHRIFDASALYGIYEPEHATPTVLGPLLNPNHLGCLMAMGAVLSLALVMFHRQSTIARVFFALGGLACAVTTAATLSRGAVLAGLGGLVIVVGVLASQRWSAAATKGRRARRRFLMTTLPLSIVTVCGLFVMVYTASGQVAQQLQDTTLQEIQEPASKYAAWRSSMQLVEETPWVGVGRGAFEPVFTRVHPASAFVTFSHPENEYVQAIVEWGIPGSIGMALLVAWLALTALRRWRDGPLAAGALGALAVVAAQSNVDFGLELLGVALPAVVVAATLAYVPLVEISSRRLWRIRIARGGTLAMMAFAVALLCMPATRTVDEDHDVLHRTHVGEVIPMRVVRAVISRHPLDYYAYAIGAQSLAREDVPEAVAYLGQALTLHPTHAGLHQRAAALLHEAGRPQQSATEYATAVDGTTTPFRLLREIVAILPDVHDAASAIPVDYRDVEAIVTSLDMLNRNDVTVAWLRLVLVARPDDLHVIDRLYTIAMSRNDYAAAELAARRRLALTTRDVKARVDLARALAKLGRWDEAMIYLADVTSWHGRVDEIADGWLILCDGYIAHRAWDDAGRCLHQLDAAGVQPTGGRTEITVRSSTVEQNRRSMTLGIPLPPAEPRPLR